MAYFSGQHNVVKLGPHRFFAENGFIRCEDGITGEYVTMTWQDFLDRLNAISEFGLDRMRKGVRSAKNADFFWWSVERDAKFCEEAVNLVRLAREQGCPDDESAVRDRNRRLPTSVSIPVIPTDTSILKI